MTTKHDLVITALQQRIGEIVACKRRNPTDTRTDGSRQAIGWSSSCAAIESARWWRNANNCGIVTN